MMKEDKILDLEQGVLQPADWSLGGSMRFSEILLHCLGYRLGAVKAIKLAVGGFGRAGAQVINWLKYIPTRPEMIQSLWHTNAIEKLGDYWMAQKGRGGRGRKGSEAPKGMGEQP